MRSLLFALFLAPTLAVAAPVNQFTPVTQSAQAVSTTSTSYLAARSGRRYLYIKNQDAAIVVYIKIGSIHSTTEGVTLAAGAVWEPQVIPAGAIWIKSASGTPTVQIVEGI